MKKIVALFLAVVMTILTFAACGKTPASRTEVRVVGLKGPTGMGMVEMMENDAQGKAKNDYTFTLTSMPDEVQSLLVGEKADFAALPVNLAAALYNKGVDISFVGINTLGVLYLLENGNTVTSIDDLRGKTIYATGQGSTPQYVLEYLLKKNGIDPEKDVTIEYLSEHAELATRLASGDAAIGLLPEPNVTVAMTSAASGGNTDLRIALDITKEWAKLGEGELVQGCIVVSNAFKKEHPEEYQRFLEEYASSAEFVVTDPESASVLIEKYEIVAKAALAKKAIPNCNICFVDGEDGIAYMRNILNVLYEANPKSIGGKIPDDAFYGK